jgi:hypothetical protein
MALRRLKKIELVKPDSEVVEAFVNKVVTDLFEFDTLEQFDSKYDNLFGRAFIYMFGKGAEYAFCWRTGEPIRPRLPIVFMIACRQNVRIGYLTIYVLWFTSK